MPALLIAVPVLCFSALILTAAASDAVSFTIPNWISLALVALFPVAALAVGLPLPTAGLHVGLGVALLLAGMVMFALRWMGGGDAKLIAAAGLWLGPAALPPFILGVALAGGGLAIVLLSLRSQNFRPLVALGPRWVNRLADSTQGIPYGVAIAVGAFSALSASPFGVALGL